MTFLKDVPALSGKRVTVMGLGLFGGGVGIVRYLLKQGARVTVTDSKSEPELHESLDALRGLPITWHFGQHPEADFVETDLVVVNPAVADNSPYLELARENGIPLESEINLFFKLCRAPIIGVTGSNGKTTTVALIGECLKRSPFRVWVGGNIGVSLLDNVEKIQLSDIVVLELSSFQLERLTTIERSPHISVLTNVIPNHLDRHGTFENYLNAKKAIFAHQKPTDWAILNFDDPHVRALDSLPSQRLFFSMHENLASGARGMPTEVRLHIQAQEYRLDISRRKIPGLFNVQNISAAVLACFAVSPKLWASWYSAIESAVAEFKGVEHRLELAAEKSGVEYYNDSIATNPHSTIAALETLAPPIVLIAGGYDKKLPFVELAQKISECVRNLVLLGQTAPQIAREVQKLKKQPSMDFCSSLEEAVRVAQKHAVKGDTVLFSPACASYDMFRNFAERGQRFKQFVAQL